MWEYVRDILPGIHGDFKSNDPREVQNHFFIHREEILKKAERKSTQPAVFVFLNETKESQVELTLEAILQSEGG